ncbi:polycomb group protein Psc [Anastrepha ludens]|uniref:polycomb group protein Psc n=1 Tax=Anastrepha ludens TaxID=28586 RepID=UPI0023B174B5|nr:polycomb group protein Psc [Anastrepha ludens]
MSPVPGATSVVGTAPAHTPSIAASTTTTCTMSAPNRGPAVSSQQQSSPSASQHASGNGNMASKKNHYNNNNNNIKASNCKNNNIGKFQQGHNGNNNKLTILHSKLGMSLEGMESVHEMKQQQQQQQQQKQVHSHKNTNSGMKAKTHDMQKQTTKTTKMPFTHATTPTTVNGTASKILITEQFSSPLSSVVGKSSPPSSAQTNCSTKSPTTTATPSTTAATSSTSLAADPLALPVITCNGVTSTPAADATLEKRTVNSTINQESVEIKEECDPQVIVKVEETSPTTTKTTASTPNHPTTAIPTITTNRKDTAAPPAETKNKSAGPLISADDATADNLIVDKPRKVLLSVMNPHIICHLCNGYLIDATTIVECLHSFCHSCLIKHLRTEQYCPRCEMMINTAKPNIKPDTTLQAIIYKLVPGLYERELMRKRAFYKDRPEEAAMATPEQRGEDTEHLIFSPSDYMSLSLEYADTDELARQNSEYGELLKPRYLQCPAMCTVGHLKKFVHGKFDIDAQRFNIDIMYKVKTIVLLDHYTLMDVAYIYTWKRDAPMRFYFRVKRCLRPVVKTRKVAAIMSVAAPEPVEIKDEVADVPMTKTINIPKITEAVVTQTDTSAVPDAMTIIPKPVASTLNANEPLIIAPPNIKEEEIDEIEETKTKTIVEVVTKPVKSPKASKTSSVSSSTESKRSQANSALDRKAEKAQQAHHSHSSPKTSKEKREAKEALKQAAEHPRDERKVENIKLKIDLSKHNSVTIINMSDPHRREITKSVRPEKEWKLKSKRDKESSPKNSPSNERKSSTPSPLTVPPLTIKAEQISPQMKTSPLAKSSSKSTETSPVAAPSCNDDEQKSQFLKSFALTPTKSVKNESLEKSPKSPKISPIHKVVTKSPTSSVRDPLKIASGTVFKGPTAPSKRKIREPVKNVAKKPKLSPPLPADDFKIKLPPSPISNTSKTSVSTVTKSGYASNDKALMAAPKTTKTLNATTYVGTPIATTSTGAKPSTSTTNSQAIMRPPIGVPPKKPSGKVGAAVHKINSLLPTQTFTRVEMVPPGNRTPIAKRYQPILPKSTRPNPFANIPSDVNKLLKDAGTEIKSIASNAKSSGKVYGPKTTAGGTTITAESTIMGPPPAPVTGKQQGQNVNQSRLGGANNANKSGSKNGKSNNSNNYLNLALFNASKTKGNEVPPGCRTPMYTPNSPIYSPSSPQYMPNYNIPTVPTYKYTPRPSGGTGSYLQSILGGGNNQMAGLFPAPPTKKDNPNVNTNSNSTTGNSSPSHGGNQKSTDGSQLQAPKRVYPFARSPSPEDPPEKQLKVKSLLNSCNINIPSSLSITITREDSESQANNASHPKHKSPVNNYIEILKLPDQPTEAVEQNKRASPPAQKLPPSHHSSSLKLLMPPTSSSPTKRDTMEGMSAAYGSASLAQMSQKSQGSMNTTFGNAQSNVSKPTNVSQNSTSKSPQFNSTPGQTFQKHANDSGQQKSNLKVCEPLKSPQSEQHKLGTEKKSPIQSPEKNMNSSPNGKTTHKSPNSTNVIDASKKFRPILPRQNPSSAISEIVPPKVTSANIIGTYSAPSGVAVKVHANKKVSPPKKSPGAQQQQPQPQVAHQQPKNGHSPNMLTAAKGGTQQPNKFPSPAHQSSSKLTSNAKSGATPPPISSPNGSLNKMMHPPHPGMPMPTGMPSLPSLPSMQNLPPTALQVAALAAGLPGMPSHLGGVSTADISKLLRAQVQAAAAAAQPGSMFYPYANAQQLSHHYSYQQAFMLDQFSRMQRAEAINDFMNKLKNGPPEKTLENIPNVGSGKAATATAPRASPGAIGSGNAASKSNTVNTSTTSAAASNSNSSNGTNATKAK